MRLAATGLRACSTERAFRCLLAPAAALLSTLDGGAGGRAWRDIWAAHGREAAMAVTDLFLSLPWLFLLITVRAVMPLNVSPLVSVLVTFLMLGLLGWTSAARVLCATAGSLRDSDFVRQAQGFGNSRGAAVLDSRAAESEAGAVCAVLDFDSGIHFERSESGNSRARRC